MKLHNSSFAFPEQMHELVPRKSRLIEGPRPSFAVGWVHGPWAIQGASTPIVATPALDYTQPPATFPTETIGPGANPLTDRSSGMHCRLGSAIENCFHKTTFKLNHNLAPPLEGLKPAWHRWIHDWVVCRLGVLLIDNGALQKKQIHVVLKSIVFKRPAEPRVSIRRVPYNKA